ncbi:MAG: 13E12 repeat family protein [Actinomycetota bacterium]|nr:13E12 repeat family protein [Actinomycetota bacterium]
MSTTLQEPSVSLPGGLESVLSVLSAALDVGQASELWQVPDRGLAGAAVECGRLTSRMQALLVRLLGEVHARDLALRSGACSTTAWTRHALNQTPREARTLVGVATALRIGMATTGAAFAAGELSLAQAAAITTTVGELPDDVPAEVRERAEAELVGYADRFDAQQLTRLGSHILTVVAPEIGEARDAEALERQEQQARRRRELFFTPDGHGTVFVRGRLTDEAAAIVRAVLDPLARPLPATADGPDPRTAGQRRADALEELARRALAGHTDTATTVFVTIPWQTLTDGLGLATLPDGTPLSPGAARRMACDAESSPPSSAARAPSWMSVAASGCSPALVAER